jgi:hypothetical protein
MKTPSLLPNPLSLPHLGAATWLTGLVVGQKFAEAVLRQNVLLTGALRSPYQPTRC